MGKCRICSSLLSSFLGAKIVGIIDQKGGLINKSGFTFEEIRKLFLNKNGNKLISNDIIPFNEINSKIWDVELKFLFLLQHQD